jgi:mono/diheme cytochrome c family protein
MMGNGLATTGVLFLALAGGAAAQDVGNATEGARLAAEECSACHAVAADDFLSPDPDAPPFVAVALEPGMGRTALLVWFRSSHPSMPMLQLSVTEEHDLIAHILSLKE